MREALARDLVREFSQGDLSSLDYSVMRERDRTILRVTPVEKPWGPDYLRFGFNLSSDFRSESRYNLRALYRRTWLDPLGAEWLLAAQIGSEQSIATDFYQPLDRRHVFFVRPFASAGLRKVPLYFEGDRLAVYRVQENRAGLEGGVNIGRERAGERGLGRAPDRRGARHRSRLVLQRDAAAWAARPPRSWSTPTTSRSSRRAA